MILAIQYNKHQPYPSASYVLGFTTTLCHHHKKCRDSSLKNQIWRAKKIWEERCKADWADTIPACNVGVCPQVFHGRRKSSIMIAWSSSTCCFLYMSADLDYSVYRTSLMLRGPLIFSNVRIGDWRAISSHCRSLIVRTSGQSRVSDGDHGGKDGLAPETGQ